MKKMLISSTINMLDDSFTSESLTIECVLSSNEISYSLKSLIDIEAADYSFIDEVIMQIIYNQLQIESLTLIKAKSIQEFDDDYAKKTHYSCHLFKSDCSRSYDWHSFYVDHSIKLTSNDSWKNMNEQNQSSNWYANWFSLIFEFHSQFEINCFTYKQQDNHEAKKFNFYSYIKEIFHYLSTQSKITLFQSVQWEVS